MTVKFANNATTTLSAGISDSAVTIPVVDASVFPAVGGADYAYLTLASSSGVEVVKVTAIAANDLTVVRAQDGTTAAAFVLGDKCELRVTVASLEEAFAPVVHGHANTDITGLGNSSTRDVGTGAGDVAQGDHGHTAPAMNDLTDVDTSGVATGDALVFNGTNYVPGASGGPGLGENSVIRTNATNIAEDITLADHSATFTADAGADTISRGTDDDYGNGDTVYVSSTTTLPAGLAAGTKYYVVGVAAATMQLSLTYGGAAVDITDTGTGTHTVYQAINGSTVGPVTIEDTFTVTVPDGSTWSIV